jgi:hypothetical protein
MICSSPPFPRSSVQIHRLGGPRHAIVLQLVDGDVLADLLLGDDLLLEHGGGALCKLVVPLLLAPRVGCEVVPHQRRLLLGDDRNIDIASRAEIVPDTRLNRVRAQLDGVVPRHLLRPLRLEDGHGSQRARAHGHVRQLIGGAVGVDGEEVCARGVDAGDDKVCADVALVAEEVLLEHGHACDDAGLAAGGEGVQFEVRGDDGRGELGVCGRAGAGAPDVGGDVVELLAVLGLSAWRALGGGQVGVPCLLLWGRWWRACLLQSRRRRRRDSPQ